jgi:formylglycine-generating enzyme required for sulfatase activity
LVANAFGVHDTIGSVWEWVEDCYVMPYPANTPTDGKPYLGPQGCDRRVSKGGSWGSSIDRQTPTFRGRDPVTLVSQVFGFRVARDLE